MQFIIKYSTEITIKSRPVRRRISQQLVRNIRDLLLPIDPGCVVTYGWDKVQLTVNPDNRQDAISLLANCSGIAYFLEVMEYPLKDLDDAFEKTAQVYLSQIAGKSFAVRCKRVGNHTFSSSDVERHVGGLMMSNADGARVQLKNPEVVVRLEIRGKQLFITKHRLRGAGGFPVGSLDPVISLVSGGFDSTVASYLAMRRGLAVNFLLFSLGGNEHKVAVQEISLYLWMKYASTQRIRFITVPFEEVVNDIQRSVSSGYSGIVMKRLMLKAAEQLSRSIGVKALVTGEAVAQVSSQTLTNLSVIDDASDMLVLRPLAFMDKMDIIDVARTIGTEEFSKHVPEYCGAVSIKPKTRARLHLVHEQEERLDPEVLEAAVANAQIQLMHELVEQDSSSSQTDELEIVQELPSTGVVLDIRHPDEQDVRPLQLTGREIVCIPFFELSATFTELPSDERYYLYCEQGLMSRLHASYLCEAGHKNVAVYRPSR
ncbi:MAG: tRNA uracil 4-sulfurtransferase ThiI [Pseudomonadales bacterium]